jgi:membrane protein YdbS with pleckstrin-like domain
MKKSILLSILFILSLGSCTIEKRKYSSGYHTTWNVQHLFPKGNSANQSQREESKLSFSPKLNSKNEYALLPIFSDSIEKQDSGEHNPLSIDSKHKKHRLAPSISDTVPKVKKKDQELPNAIELKDQLQIDKKLVARSWLVLLFSVITFIGSIAMLLGTDSEFAYVLWSLGSLGVIVSIILIIVFTIIKNKHKNQLKLDQRRLEPSPAFSEEEKNLLQKRLDKLTRKIRIIKILITTSAIIALMLLLFLLTSGYSSAAIGALEIFIFLLLLFLSIRIIQRNKKAKIEDRLNTTS